MGLTVNDFLELLASAEPAPGGGSVAALNLATGAALVEMVTNLTIGRKRFAEVEDEMIALQKQVQALRLEALELVQKDTDAYLAVRAAYGLPRESDEEKSARRQAIVVATRGAIEVPLHTAKRCLFLCQLAIQSMERGNENAASDGLVASYQAQAACLGAIANVVINLDSLDDDEEINVYTAQVNQIQEDLEKLMLKAVLLGKAKVG